MSSTLDKFSPRFRARSLVGSGALRASVSGAFATFQFGRSAGFYSTRLCPHFNSEGRRVGHRSRGAGERLLQRRGVAVARKTRFHRRTQDQPVGSASRASTLEIASARRSRKPCTSCSSRRIDRLHSLQETTSSRQASSNYSNVNA